MLYLAMISVFFILAACETKTSVHNTDSSQSAENGKNAQVTDVSPADRVAYDGALKLKDISLCKKIMDEKLSLSCGIILSDAASREESVAKKDASVCEKMSSPAGREECRMQVEVALRADEKNEQIKKDNDLYGKMFESQKFDRCEDIKDAPIRELCRQGEVVRRAIDKRDIAICSEMMPTQFISGCQKAYDESAEIASDIINRAIAKKNRSLCDKIPVKFNADACRSTFDKTNPVMTTQTQQ